MTPNEITPHLSLWPGLERATATLINLSENHTFRLDCPNGQRYILRVHRPGYQGHAAIISELSWLMALNTDTQIPTPTPLTGHNGDLVQTAGGRHAVLFAFNPGHEPLPDQNLPALFAQLGTITARCHLHAQNWTQPKDFTRPIWDVPAMLGKNGLWGDWRQAPNLPAEGEAVLEAAATRLNTMFDDYGKGADRFGLIHADMRLANLLTHNEQIRLLDFDDCGTGWFIYDFAASVSFMEDTPIMPALWDQWVDSYTAIRPLTEADRAMRDPALLLRRMLLLAWIGSHNETPLAQAHSQNFAKGTIAMAHRFLDQP